ncbi:hypothetical protein [Nitratireductor sp. GCM10026969]|uniref:hypothetical protein n=1 Tax=Nitratireductor sp. GCM10026969 TaxID=3252645 RepID=UPI003619E4D0
MPKNALLISTVILAASMLSGCIYDSGYYSDDHDGFRSRGVYAAGGVVLGQHVLGAGDRPRPAHGDRPLRREDAGHLQTQPCTGSRHRPYCRSPVQVR